jgi:pimeloyl-ACP methyl ester carboxylesterase
MEEARTFITADGATIAYRIKRRTAAPARAHPRSAARAGQQHDPVVGIHGDHASCEGLRPAAPGPARPWRLPEPGPRRHGVWCGDLAALLRAEHVERAELIGHCLGANLALWFARRHPDMVSGLVLIEPMFRAALSGRMATVATLRPLIAALIPPLLALAALGVHRRRLATLDLAELDRAARKAMAAAGGTFPTGRYASPARDLRLLPLVVYLQDLLAVTGPLPDLSRLKAPVLTLLSTGGAFGDPQVTARLLAALPHGRIESLDALHWIPTEQPQAMREAIEGWCDRSG